MPNKNPIITPIFPILFNNPAIIPEIANAAICTGSPFWIIAITTPIVTPDVAPTKIPFCQPNINTTNTLKIFLIENPNMLISLNAAIAIAINKLVPISSSIANAFLVFESFITEIELLKIL